MTEIKGTQVSSYDEFTNETLCEAICYAVSAIDDLPETSWRRGVALNMLAHAEKIASANTLAKVWAMVESNLERPIAVGGRIDVFDSPYQQEFEGELLTARKSWNLPPEPEGHGHTGQMAELYEAGQRIHRETVERTERRAVNQKGN